MGGQEYLQVRRGRWYVRVRVPADLVQVIGRTHVLRSLQTEDVRLARQRRRQVLAELWAEFANLTVLDGWTPSRAWRTVTNGALNGSISSAPALEQPRPNPVGDSPSKPQPNRQSQKPTDREHTLTTLLERWLAENIADSTNQTLGQHRTTVSKFLGKHSPKLMAVDVTRKMAGEHVSELIGVEKSQKTVNRKLSSLSSFWRWMIQRGLTEYNPWAGQGAFSARVKRSQSKKRAYSEVELRALLSASPETIIGERYGCVIRDLIRLGLLTGCRIGELCDFRVEDVLIDARAVRIPRGKTENARRVMPIHHRAWPIVARRIGASEGGWLFPNLTPGGPDGKRSWIVVKRFATFRQKVLGLDKSVDFHSLRRTFATYLERASVGNPVVNHSTIAELMGHSKPTLALSVYSAGLVPSQLRLSIDALDRVLEPGVLRCI